MSYLTQMVGLTLHNFRLGGGGNRDGGRGDSRVRRGAARKTIGNFWVDLTRTTLWVLLPISIIFALVLVWQGVPDNFSPYTHVHDASRAPRR